MDLVTSKGPLAAVAAAALWCAALPGCTAPNPAFCATSTDCDDGFLCDQETSTCQEVALGPCERGEDCASEVCDRASRSCRSGQEVVYVDAVVGRDEHDCGKQRDPCRSIGAGLAKVTAERDAVRIRAGRYEEVVAVEDQSLSLVAAAGAVLAPPDSPDPAAVRVAGDGVVRIEQLTIAGSSADGIRCSGGARLVLVETTVEDSAGVGVSANACALIVERATLAENQGAGLAVVLGNLVLERSAVSGNRGGGISVVNSAFSMTNNFVVGNGDLDVATFGGMVVSNTGAVESQVFEFNTVADNLARATAPAAGIACTATDPITVRSSIVFGNQGGQGSLAGDCEGDFSNIEGASGGTNMSRDPLFVDPARGDYHLLPSSPCRNAANPFVSKLKIDFDGDRRPLTGGWDMGADEVPAN